MRLRCSNLAKPSIKYLLHILKRAGIGSNLMEAVDSRNKGSQRTLRPRFREPFKCRIDMTPLIDKQRSQQLLLLISKDVIYNRRDISKKPATAIPCRVLFDPSSQGVYSPFLSQKRLRTDHIPDRAPHHLWIRLGAIHQ